MTQLKETKKPKETTAFTIHAGLPTEVFYRLEQLVNGPIRSK